MQNQYSKIHFIAANYSRLQGLRAIPVGLLAVYVSVWALYNQGPTAHLSEPILVAVITSLLYFLTDRYYNRVFGQVKQSPGKRKMELIASVAIGALALLAFILDTTRILPISALSLIFAACFLEYFWRTDKSEWRKIVNYFPESIIAAILVSVAGILPLFGFSVWEVFGIRSQIVGMVMLFGIAILITGIWGHIRLIRTLRLVEAKSNDVAL